MKNKITYGDKFSTNFCGLNVTEDGVEYKSFTVNYIDSLPVHENKYCLQVHLDNFACKIIEKQMIDYLDHSLLSLISVLNLMNGPFKW